MAPDHDHSRLSSPALNEKVINGQLQHHWAGATAGVAFFNRVGRTHPDPEASTEVQRLSREVAEDRESLRTIMVSLGVSPSTIGAGLARAGEWVGRFKPNGHLITRSPLSDVVELEGLRVAVWGKRLGWQLLRELAVRDPRLDRHELERLIERADAQLETLERLHLRVGRERAFDGGA